jgi:hypothetical protein
MFWGSFSWDSKGPCHIWKPESKKDFEESKKTISEMNTEI